MKIEEGLKLTKHKCRFKRFTRSNYERIETIKKQINEYFKQQAQ